jgi:DNA-binding NtrC family response regulator
MPKIDLALVVCNQEDDREKAIEVLLKCGLNPICCSNLLEARTLLPQERFRVVLCKDFLTDGDFRAVLREVKKSDTHTPLIVLSRSADWDSYLKALGAGAFAYIVCPPNPEEAETIILNALAGTIGTERVSQAAA